MDDLAEFVFSHYPEKVFTPFNAEEQGIIIDALNNCGVNYASDRLHAEWARHLGRVYQKYRDEEE